MRYVIVYNVLRFLRRFCQLLLRYEGQWVGKVPEDRWHDYRLVAILNHTSLYEWVFAGIVPDRFLLRMSRYGLIPIADKTMKRPIAGRLWRFTAGNVVSITRERDQTWEKVLESLDPQMMPIILPEGRMKRANGKDAYGRPLVVRGGIAEILEAMSDGQFLIAYSQGLHHIQVPGQVIPNMRGTVRMRFESVDIAEYRAEMEAKAEEAGSSFRAAVVADLQARRDRYCTSDRGEAVPYEGEEG